MLRVLPLQVLIFVSLTWGLHAQTSISGVINRYTPVTGFDNCAVLVESSAGFAVMDRVLVIQMAGAEIIERNDSSYGTVLEYHGAGLFEFARVASVSGNRIELTARLVNSYEVAGSVQLIYVPEYADVSVDGVLRAAPWNGRTGGVVVLEASGEVVLNADIDVSRQGFHGGDAREQRTFEPNYAVDYVGTDSNKFGAKGEGIAGYGSGMNVLGRGSAANGGGGGGNHNGGGGGGSNGGCGGVGGYGYRHARYSGDYQRVQGRGGREMGGLEDRLFLGGGGGAGHTNNRTGSDGGNGGGIVLLRAERLRGNDHRIVSDGDSALTANYDGAGGGGGGGSIGLSVGSYIGRVRVRSEGGKGGNNHDDLLQEEAGPGGGGGGGRVCVSQGTIPVEIAIESLDGGSNGLTFHRNAYGSMAGCTGIATTDFAVPEGTEVCNDVEAEVDYTLYLPDRCLGTSEIIPILFHSRKHTDTIVSIRFEGASPRFFSYAGPQPIQIVIRPTIDMKIPVLCTWLKTGEFTAVMVLQTSYGDTFRIKLISHGKAPVATTVLNVSEVRLGNRSVAFDTCMTVVNTYNQAITIADTIWLRNGRGYVEFSQLSLPLTLYPGQSTQLCLHIRETQSTFNDTLMFGGSIAVPECPGCIVHAVSINGQTLVPNPTLSVHSVGTEGDFDLTAAPNFSSSYINLLIRSTAHRSVSLDCYDASGRVVPAFSGVISLERGSQSHTLDISSLTPGKYYIVAKTETIKKTIEILVR